MSSDRRPNRRLAVSPAHEHRAQPCVAKSISLPSLISASANDTPTRPKERRSVTSAPLPPPCFGRSASSPPGGGDWRHITSRGFRWDYSIGDTVRYVSHMVVEPTPEEAFMAASSLRRHDFAFVRRSDGSYSYAILAFRSLGPPHDHGGSAGSLEESMAFVMCREGSIKMLKKKHWGEYVRLVSMDGLDTLRNTGSAEQKHKKKSTNNGCVLPSIISFLPTGDEYDDYSLSDHSSW